MTFEKSRLPSAIKVMAVVGCEIRREFVEVWFRNRLGKRSNSSHIGRSFLVLGARRLWLPRFGDRGRTVSPRSEVG